MRRGFRRDTAGATAIEFAFVFPIMCSLMFGGLALAFAIWTQNILQDAAQETARCVAQGLSACATVPAGCDSSAAGVCYAETVAANRGLSSLAANNVSINISAASGGVSFTTVTISYAFAFSAYTLFITGNYTLVGYGAFPNVT
jgi:Flp pilus assembly protein TadG